MAWAAPADVGGAAFNRKFCFISLTNSSIAITSLLVCLLGIILELPSIPALLFCLATLAQYNNFGVIYSAFCFETLFCSAPAMYRNGGFDYINFFYLFFFSLRLHQHKSGKNYKMSTFSIIFLSFPFFFFLILCLTAEKVLRFELSF